MAKRTTKKTTKVYSANVQAVLDRITKKTGRIPTSYQADIVEWLAEGTGHCVVNAVAGSGKTTVLTDSAHALTFGTKRPSILFLAFNKSIAEELQARISLANCTAKTLNSLGAGLLFKNLKHKPILNDSKTDIVAKGIVGFDQLSKDKESEFLVMLPAIRRLVALFKGFGFGAIRDMPNEKDVMELCDRYDIELPEPDQCDINKFFDVLFRTYQDGLENMNVIDFNDQLLLPIYHNMPFPSYFNFVFVDESQDLNPIQAEMVRRISGRKIFVGDRNQAIYGFRGADPESMDNIVADFKATELPLSICWRCPKNVIETAQRIVPHIQASPNATDGKVETINEERFFEMVQEGDMVVNRTCAPLVEYCMQLIRDGRKATVKGSDIGKGLCVLSDKIARKRIDGTVWDQIETWGTVEVKKICKPGQENKASALQDRVDTLKVLAEGCETWKELKDKIASIFSDTTRGIVLSTIHRVKGEEEERVFILHPELLPHPMAKKAWARQQESNLEYVAITRATRELYWVIPANPIKFKRFAS